MEEAFDRIVKLGVVLDTIAEEYRMEAILMADGGRVAGDPSFDKVGGRTSEHLRGAPG
jgi:hypothetical protein